MKHIEWIYRSPLRGSDSDLEYYKPNFQDVYHDMGSSKISWSSDKKYIVLEAAGLCWYTYSIYRIEIHSGEIETNMTGYCESVQEPDVQHGLASFIIRLSHQRWVRRVLWTCGILP
jgi:hypothetical protein